MTKEEEIALLKKLGKDTYFAQFFTRHDIDQMCVNISNDLAIEMNCPFARKLELKEAELTAFRKDTGEALDNVCRRMILETNGVLSKEAREMIACYSGETFVVKTKLANGLSLTDDERKLVISHL